MVITQLVDAQTSVCICVCVLEEAGVGGCCTEGVKDLL